MLARVFTSTSSTLARSRSRQRITWATAPTPSLSSSSFSSTSTSPSTSLHTSSLCTCSLVSFSLSSSLPFPFSFSSSSSSSSSSSYSFSSSRSFSTTTSTSITSKPRLISLSNISDNRGARTKRTRVGRGPGSGLGKTAGRGHKGTWARRSLSKPGFEGGQTPLHRTMPKRGFTNIFATPPAVVDLKRVQMWIDHGRIRSDEPITIKTLWDSGCVTKVQYGIKILSHGGQLKQPTHFEVTDVSSKAKEAIDAAGGSVKLVYFNRVGLRHHLKPEKFAPGFQPPGSSSIPPPKKQSRYALQGVRPVVLRQTAAQIALTNLKAAAQAEAAKAANKTTTTTTQKSSDAKKEKKEKKKAATTTVEA